MADWRYMAYRLNGDATEDYLADIPLQSPSITNVLSGPNGLTGSISPAVAMLLDDNGEPILQRWSTAIYAAEGNTIRSGCIVTDITRSPGSATLGLTGAGFTAAIKGQPYQGSVSFTEREPLDIARHIWDHWQSQPKGNLGLILDRATKTGKKIGTVLKQVEFDTQNGPVSFESGPYKLNEWETDDLGGAFDGLAKDQEFDYREWHQWKADGSGVEHHLDFGAPRIGKRRDDITFVAGENVISLPDDSMSSEAYASILLVRGAGEGRTMKRQFVPRAGETRLRRIKVVEDKSLKSDAAVQARGRADLPLYLGKPTISEIIVRDHQRAPIGSWSEGDEVEYFGDLGGWGTGLYTVRILSTTYSPNDLSVARLAVEPADTIAA